MLEVENGDDESPADVDERKDVDKEKGRASTMDETEEEQEPSSGVEHEDGASGDDEEKGNQGAIEFKKKKKKDKKPKSSKSLKKEKEKKDKDEKPKSSKSLKKEKKDKDEKPKSSTSLKKKKKKKTKEKDEEKKKKKGDSSKKKLVRDESFERNDDEQQESNQIEESKEQQKENATKETPSTEKGEKTIETPSCASVSVSTVTDDSAIHKSMMTSLRRSEKARASREMSKVYDSDDDGLWVGTKEDTPRRSEASRSSTGGTTALSSKSRKNKKGRKKPRKARDKSDWESSVAADDSHIPYDSDYSDEDYSNRHYSSRSMMSDTSADQPASFRSNGRSHRSMHRSMSGRSHRSISGRSHRSTSGTSFKSSSGFQAMKQDRNSSVKKSILEDDIEDAFSLPSSKSDKKPLSRIELRKDLEAQARQRVEKNSNKQEKGEILATLKKSIHRLSSVFEPSAVDSKFLEEVAISDDEERGTQDSDEKDKSKGDDKEAKDDDNIEKLDRKQKWVALKEKARTRKGYIVIISVVVALFVIANIILIVYLTKE